MPALMEPWYKITMPRAEVREGRSFNPDEFAIALEQVGAGKAPLDYRDAKVKSIREECGFLVNDVPDRAPSRRAVRTGFEHGNLLVAPS
jgi:hypothetical protein